MRSATRRWLWDRFVEGHVAAYRLTGGRIGARVRGVDVLLLHHVGRRSGKERITPLLYIEDGDDVVIVGSKGGSPKHPAWFLNLREMEEATVQIGSERRRVRVRQATVKEKRRLWPRLVEAWPDYAAYQRRTERQIPLVILSPIEGSP